LKRFLDDVCIDLNERFSETHPDFEGEASSVSETLDRMSSGITAGIEIFDRNRFCRKIVDGIYETRFNRAIFDVLVGALSEERIREKAIENKDKFMLLRSLKSLL
jgi:hypothetical protein